MAKYTIKDFHKGDQVYHLSNPKLAMVALATNEELNEVTCRWVDKNGKKQVEEFMPEELGKEGDNRPRIRMVSI